jgi:hypothetical protein
LFDVVRTRVSVNDDPSFTLGLRRSRMALRRSTDQRAEDLYDSYRCFDEPQVDSYWKECAEAMLRLLPHLEELCRDLPVWGLTSHESLVPLSEPA